MFFLLFSCLVFAEESVLKSLENPPVVLKRVEPVFPTVSVSGDLHGVIVLQIDLNEFGEVIFVDVLKGFRDDFDNAAKNAVEQFRFSPFINAKGEAVPSRIEYQVAFDIEAQPIECLQGTVLDSEGAPLSDVLFLLSKGEAQKSFQSEEDGSFHVFDLEDGEWALLSQKDGFDIIERNVTISSGQITILDLTLAPIVQAKEDATDFEIVIEERAQTSEMVERYISAEEIFVLPGSNGDVVKAVQNLPGISRAPLGIGQLIIRGTAPEDSTYYIDGGNIPDVFHFGGLTTIVSTEVIEEVSFLPGNYSVRYGRQIGGLVDIRTKAVLPKEFEGVVSVDLYQSAFYVSQPLGDKWALSLSGRRSYADVFLNPILNGTGISLRAPRYYDAQARLSFAPSESEFMDLMFFMSDDMFQFLGEDAEGQEQNTLLYSKNFYKVRFRWNKSYAGGVKQSTVMVAGPERQDFDQGATGESFEQRWGINLRHEWNRPLSPTQNIGFRVGIDMYSGIDSFLYDIPSFPYPKEEGEFFFLSPAFYGEFSYRKVNTTITAGLRAEGYTLGNEICVPAYDPRMSIRQQVGDWIFKSGFGLFSQFPEPRELDPAADGVADLSAERSWQSSVGFEVPITSGLTVDASGFYNVLDQVVVGRGDRFEFFTGPPLLGPKDTESYANLGTGLIYGIESQIRFDGEGFLALLAATVSHSERTDRNGNVRLFAYDQPFLINALFTKKLPRNWRLGGRVRYGAGNPYTPVQNSVYDLNRREFIPVYADYDSGRLPSFFSLDIRVDKIYTFSNWSLTAYLDIQNITNYPNLELMSWSYDFEKEEPITGNPLFPAFGFKGVF